MFGDISPLKLIIWSFERAPSAELLGRLKEIISRSSLKQLYPLGTYGTDAVRLERRNVVHGHRARISADGCELRPRRADSERRDAARTSRVAINTAAGQQRPSNHLAADQIQSKDLQSDSAVEDH